MALRADAPAWPSDKIAGLLAWFQQAGITLSTDLVRLAPTGLKPGACEVRAVADIPRDAVLGTIPADACLSVRTTCIAELLETLELGGGLALILAVMHERSLGTKSKWCAHTTSTVLQHGSRSALVCTFCRHGYFQSLPVREYVPLFWSEQELERLKGTEAHATAVADRQVLMHTMAALQSTKGLTPYSVTGS